MKKGLIILKKNLFITTGLYLFTSVFLILACSNGLPSEKPDDTAPAEAVPAAVAAKTVSAQPEVSKTVSAPVIPAKKLPASSKIAKTRELTVEQEPAAKAVQIIENDPIASTVPDHGAWNTLLQKHVNSAGKVQYKGFKEDKDALDAYCQLLADHVPADEWSRANKMAYWVNAYNAFTVRLIVDNYPVSGILKLDGGKTWDVKRILLGGKKYSLNQIENEILRPQFKDARIHFVLSCAAKSCPPLLNKALTANNLEKTLEERTQKFINNPLYNTIGADKIQVSKIFDWYAVDFGDLRKFLAKYAEVKINDNAILRFTEYNWDLNE